MLPLFRMLDFRGLSLADAEAGGLQDLAAAAQRCQRCADTATCIRWMKWHGRYGLRPCCPNSSYFDRLSERHQPD
jgi:hypothetical protein